MREIKYRVFDRLTNKMIEVTKLEWGKHSLSGFEGRTGDSGGWHNVHKGYFNERGRYNGSENRQRRYVLMQYTGLKDKNGMEICEGDICRVVTTDGDVSLDLVTFSNGGYKLADTKGLLKPISIGDQIIKTIEVAGNEFENPELLEVE